MRYEPGILTRRASEVPMDDLPSETRWYVVQSKPRKEIFAGSNLVNQGFRIFLPKLRKTVRHARRSRQVERALFPRYLFVALDLSRDRWRSVTGTFGVSHFVTDGTGPLPAPRGLIEGMIAASDPAGVLDLSRMLVAGQAVQLLDGPLAGQIGRLLHLDGAGRARVLLQILGADRAIAVSAASLAPAGGAGRD